MALKVQKAVPVCYNMTEKRESFGGTPMEEKKTGGKKISWAMSYIAMVGRKK